MAKRLTFKQGAASFYIVAFSTLILLIIATSFAAVIISEITRTSNADLSQSAYDSALAGVEDAKLAYYNYNACIAKEGISPKEPEYGSTTLTCENIIWYMENGDCDMVAHILGRIGTEENREVVIQESTSGSNNMQQAYTCNKINLVTTDYVSSLSANQQLKVFRVKFDDETTADQITSIKVYWFSDNNGQIFSYANFPEHSDDVVFKPLNIVTTPTPPTISVAMLQTGETFDLESFNTTIGEETNRGMIYLVPTNNSSKASTPKEGANYRPGYNSEEKQNHIGKEGFLLSNDKRGDTNKNLPYAVYCDPNGSNYACSATIDIPKPIGDFRSDETFVFALSLPYGEPATNVRLLFCKGPCIEVPEQDGGEDNIALLKGVQISVDSTGRANNLYRRVLARLESDANDYPLSILGPLELLGNGEVLKKNYAVTKEWNFQ